MSHPKIIQGGMGIGISCWRLARAVSRLGQLGVVSGAALDVLLARRLQDGDLGGHVRHALERFPSRQMADRVWETYFVPGGKELHQPYKAVPMHSKKGARELVELCIVANFVEVFLAREGHDGPVGINYLEKVQLPHLPSLYGAMLGGVGYVLMGAGIPHKIPEVLDRFTRHEPAAYPLHVVGARESDDTMLRFDPHEYLDHDRSPLRRPFFIPIIASNTLATTLLKKSKGRVDGFIIEGPTAGGHNAPPRGKLRLNESGEPVYGERDHVDLDKIRELGLPFWVAGGWASPEKLREVLSLGGAGIQVGTAFALCEESGLEEEYKRRLVEKSMAGTCQVFTDPIASPAGFPFKVARLERTLSERDVYQERTRACDLGYLREAYRRADGTVGYRCPAEPIESYVLKGGSREDTDGRKCLCNALLANVGQAQIRKGGVRERPLITCGDALAEIKQFLPSGRSSYTARDVVERLLADESVPCTLTSSSFYPPNRDPLCLFGDPAPVLMDSEAPVVLCRPMLTDPVQSF
ncbi:MAG: nitronate monooxygenase [Planctomycetes bacterium]|nr:nitronate monooxygenase [Planctomycetota bacterium]